MAMDLAALRVEVFSGPYGYLNDGGTQAARVDRWINQAYKELCTQAPWPFLETTSTGAAPLTVSDLGAIQTVFDSNGRKLHPMQYDTLVKLANTSLSLNGLASYYYITSGTIVNTFPVATTSITVRYYKVPVDLSSAGDLPLVPDEYRDIIATGALRRCAIDNQAWQAAAGYRQEWDSRVLDMVSAEIEAPQYQQIVYGSEDQ